MTRVRLHAHNILCNWDAWSSGSLLMSLLILMLATFLAWPLSEDFVVQQFRVDSSKCYHPKPQNLVYPVQFFMQCTGVHNYMQTSKPNSEGRAWLLLASQKWKANHRQLHTSMWGKPFGLSLVPHHQYSRGGWGGVFRGEN